MRFFPRPVLFDININVEVNPQGLDRRRRIYPATSTSEIVCDARNE